MGYTLYDIEVDVTAKLHGGSIIDFPRSVDEGRRRMLKVIKPPELVRSVDIEQALYDQVDKYAVPDDLKYDNINELWMLSAKRNVDTLQHPLELVFRRQFDQKRFGAKNMIAITNENGKKYAKIYHPRGLRLSRHLSINEVDSLSDNGTWNVGGNVTNLRLDKIDHITGHASLKFDINNSSTTGFIENFTMKAVDISEYLENGAVFEWLNLPLPNEMLSVKLTLGSGAPGNLITDQYWNTVNAPHDNDKFITGWNLLKYMLNEINSIPNPNPKAINFFRLDFTTTGNPIPGCNIDNVVARKGVMYRMLYNSAWCIIDPKTGEFKQKMNNNADVIPFEEDTYDIFMLEVALSAQQELYANNFGADTDITKLQGLLNDAYSLYFLNHTDESIKPTESSYVSGTMYDGYTEDSVLDGGDQDQDFEGEPNDFNSN